MAAVTPRMAISTHASVERLALVTTGASGPAAVPPLAVATVFAVVDFFFASVDSASRRFLVSEAGRPAPNVSHILTAAASPVITRRVHPLPNRQNVPRPLRKVSRTAQYF